MNRIFLFIVAIITSVIISCFIRANASELTKIECTYQSEKGIVNVFSMTDTSVSTHQVVGDMDVKVYIKNTSKLSEIDDYILFTKGDKNILFSLKCKKII